MNDPVPIEDVRVVEYDPRWVDEFQGYAATLTSALGSRALGIEHVGSTSVVGLAAKPIIDIDVVISSRVLLDPVVRALATIDYLHEGDLGIPGREAFRWPDGSRRHHVYVCSVDTPNLHNHLLFRDYLRAHPEAALRYGTLKRDAAARYHNDEAAYTEAKSSFISDVLEQAQAQYGPGTTS